ncbi:chemotaxis protein CheW [Sorangium sp. So ce1335]|uniref:chemotaxis protein CheW n=1 Tax=Sorangium sp. So ce1335 TaxID=3133335 RepID=UPI003F604888
MTSLADRLAALRDVFDASFAAPARPCAEEPARALAIRAGDRRLVARIDELAAVEPCRRLVPLAGGPPDLLGLAGLRGRLVAVYDLAALVGGRPRAGVADAAAGPAPRWLLVCAGSPEIALAIDEVEGHASLPRASPGAGAGPRARARDGDDDEHDDERGEHVKEVVDVGGTPRGLLRVPAVAATVLRRAQRGAERPRGDR